MEEINTHQSFVYKSYSKAELAQLYFPYHAKTTAVRKFNICLQVSTGFWNQLQDAGVDLCTRYYTAAQVQLIVNHLGEP